MRSKRKLDPSQDGKGRLECMAQGNPIQEVGILLNLLWAAFLSVYYHPPKQVYTKATVMTPQQELLIARLRIQLTLESYQEHRRFL
ncbi:unnamed protein product [Protopolystoma xenopodis]|uniref:Uncharacterized protein n=1 Tax=Protopolystoma xenopodis TaxID=117903 RepID=A0A3S5CHQ3_9PLAT|nr:unnamed protein product [Protopolystoma xenopodis]